jgi:hypothetical protein
LGFSLRPLRSSRFKAFAFDCSGKQEKLVTAKVAKNGREGRKENQSQTYFGTSGSPGLFHGIK